MKNKIIIISLFLCIALYTKADNKEWKEGYIITNNNDTIRGLLAYRNGEDDWKNCLFKKTETDSIQAFTPLDVKEFFYNIGIRFEAINLEVKSKTNLYFAECLLKGSMSLYYLKINNEYFYESYYSVNSLTGRIVAIEPLKDCTDYYTKIKRKNLLKALFNSNPILNKEINEHGLERNNLIDYFKKYNDLTCSEYVCVSYNEEKKKRKKYLSVFAGPIVSMENDDYDEAKYSTRYFCPVLGVKLHINPSKISERTFLCLGIQNYTYYLKDDENTNSKLNVLSFSVGTEYRYMSSKLKPDFEFGLFFSTRNSIIDSSKNTNTFAGYSGFYTSLGINIPCNKTEIPIHFYYSQDFSLGYIRNLGLTIGYRFKIGK